MSRPLLRVGFRGQDVVDLQKLLNSKLSKKIAVDGTFGERETKAAVIEYQRIEGLVVDGIVGPCTWTALLGKDKYKIEYRVTPVAQLTPTTCWLAGASMVLNRTIVGPGSATILPNGALNDTDNNLAEFAKSFGLRLHLGQSWMVDGLAGLLLQHGPLLMCGYFPSGHCVVIGGLRGDGMPQGTTLTIYDPDGGRVYPEIYGSVMRRFPLATSWILHR